MSDLIREISSPIRIDFMSVSSYGNSTVSSGIVRITNDLHQDIQGCSVLIVEDIIDTGNTLHYLREYLKNRGAEDVKICALLDKPSRRQVEVPVEYVGFEVEDRFIIGYGIDYAEKYRNLPFIGTLKQSAD
jgi:hypoxanthine phosphoribosyltransferase